MPPRPLPFLVGHPPPFLAGPPPRCQNSFLSPCFICHWEHNAPNHAWKPNHCPPPRRGQIKIKNFKSMVKSVVGLLWETKTGNGETAPQPLFKLPTPAHLIIIHLYLKDAHLRWLCHV